MDGLCEIAFRQSMTGIWEDEKSISESTLVACTHYHRVEVITYWHIHGLRSSSCCDLHELQAHVRSL